VSTAPAVALTLLVLAAAGALPVLLTVGPRLVALPLFPLAGAVLGAVSAGCSIALAGSMVMWFTIWSLAVAAGGAWYLARRPELGRAMVRALRGGVPPLVGAGAVAVALAVAWTLRTLTVPNVGYDTRTIWLIHARWLTQGHAFALAAARNHFLVVTHPGYPPLISSVMALAWRVSGTSTDRVAVVMVAMLNACALLVAGWGIVEAARRGAARLHHEGRRPQLLLATGIVTAVVVVVVAGGVLGTFFTNGYADPLWSLAAVSAVVYGLVLPMTRSDLAVAAVMIAVAGLTKIEGTAVALVLLFVITAREVARRRALAAPSLGPRRFSAVLAAVLALLTWPVLTEWLGMPTDPSLSGVRQGSLASRAHGTFSAMVPHLHVLGLAAVCSVAGFALLRPLRARLGLGHDGWTWVAVVAAVIVLGGAYVLGPGNVELWLDTSINRTTIFVALLGWWIVALWAFCGSAGASTYSGAWQQASVP
jgi:hypothetical protein